MTEREMCEREFTGAELLAILPIRVDAITERNPFHKVIGDPVGSKNSHRWTVVHGWRSEGDARPVEPSSPEDALLAALARERSGFHRSEGGSGGFAIFPVVPNYRAGSPAQRELERDWEAKARELSESVETITLEPKPVPEFPGFDLRRGS